MKKFAIALSLAGIAGLGLAGVSPAEARTTPGVTPPTQCTVTLPADSTVVVAEAAVLPNCVDLEYLCVEVVNIVGPARAAHVRPQGDLPAGPCAAFPAECTIPVIPNSDGPSRVAHRAARSVPAQVKPYFPGATFDIPETCDDVLVSTGTNSTPVMLLGLAMFGVGAAFLTVSRRRSAVLGGR